MTKLQVAINNLKETCIAAELLLEKLKKAQRNSEKSVGKFPFSFIAVKDDSLPDHYVLGLKNPIEWAELPKGFAGRACYDKAEIQQIIRGLQILIGESDD
jgi:hypothetical protein